MYKGGVAFRRGVLMERTLDETAVLLSLEEGLPPLTRERIRQIEVRAFEKLQKAMLAAASEEESRPAAA